VAQAQPDQEISRRFKATIAEGPRGSIIVPVPFDPDAVWGKKPLHHVNGMVGPCGVRGTMERIGGGFGLKLGPAWVRDAPVGPGDNVEVTLAPEGPQRGALEPDIAAALTAEPEAAAFFDGLAQFYRRAYLTWIAGTKRRPEERARRIAETVRLLKAGIKQRPQP
jgi:hypothetical protein